MQSTNIFRRKKLAHAVSTAVALTGGVSHVAVAQSQKSLEEVTVTGSRIVNRDL